MGGPETFLLLDALSRLAFMSKNDIIMVLLVSTFNNVEEGWLIWRK